MNKAEKLARRLTSIARALCIVAAVCSFGIMLGTAGAVDMAGDASPNGWVAQALLGIAGMLVFGTLATVIGNERDYR